MLIGIGSKKPPEDVVDLLLDCHTRIRSFSRLAVRIAERTEVADAEIAEAAARVRRYFSVALPLHVADEEESIVPRLTGRDPAVDAALARMEEEHEGHEEDLRRLVAICAALEEAPATLPSVRAELAEVGTRLVRAFDEHLRSEEETIFPALRSFLPKSEREAIFAELRARRRSI